MHLSPDEDEENIKNRVEIFHTKEGDTTRSQTLALVFRKDTMSLLYTTGRQITPVCSSCTATKCTHLRMWKDESNKQVSKSNSNADEITKPIHYFLQETVYHNDTPIIYPLQTCPIQSKIINEKENGMFTLPLDLIPVYDDQKVCQIHGHRFISDESGLVLVSKTVKIFTETGVIEKDSNVYVRKSYSCKCLQQVDGHPWLLFHVGWGRMVCYLTLDAYVIDMVRSGSTVRAFHSKMLQKTKSRTKNNYDLSYDEFLTAKEGFFANAQVDVKQSFSCTNCGTSPRYFVADGTSLAPLKRKLEPLNLSELSPHPEDKTPLSQSSKHDERTFLHLKIEREAITKLITGETSVSNFCEQNSLTSPNGILIKGVIERLR